MLAFLQAFTIAVQGIQSMSPVSPPKICDHCLTGVNLGALSGMQRGAFGGGRSALFGESSNNMNSQGSLPLDGLSPLSAGSNSLSVNQLQELMVRQ